jgi:hypothetical protein
MAAAARIAAVVDPWPLCAALAQSTWLEKVIERQRRPAFAINACLPRIASRAAILEPEWLLACFASGRVLVYHAAPINILQMTVLASADKPDRRNAPPLAVIPAIVEPFGSIQLLKAHQPPPIGRIT